MCVCVYMSLHNGVALCHRDVDGPCFESTFQMSYFAVFTPKPELLIRNSGIDAVIGLKV